MGRSLRVVAAPGPLRGPIGRRVADLAAAVVADLPVDRASHSVDGAVAVVELRVSPALAVALAPLPARGFVTILERAPVDVNRAVRASDRLHRIITAGAGRGLARGLARRRRRGARRRLVNTRRRTATPRRRIDAA